MIYLDDKRNMDAEKLSVQQLGPGVLMMEFCREYGITPMNTTTNRVWWQPTLLKLNCHIKKHRLSQCKMFFTLKSK